MIKVNKIEQNNIFDKITCIICNKKVEQNILKHNCKLRDLNININIKINNNI